MMQESLEQGQPNPRTAHTAPVVGSGHSRVLSMFSQWDAQASAFWTGPKLDTFLIRFLPGCTGTASAVWQL